MWDARDHKFEKITPNNLVSGIHYYSSTATSATSSLYQYNPTPQPSMVIYKYSNTTKNKEYCEMNKPTIFWNSSNFLV